MLLSLLPFPEESFLLRRKTLAGLFSAILVAAAAVFSVLVWLADGPGRPVTPTGILSVFANFFMGAMLLLCVALLFYFLRTSILKKLLVLCLVLDYAIFIHVGTNTLLSLIPFSPTPFYGKYSILSAPIFALFTLFLLPFIWRFMHRKLSVSLEQIEPKELQHALQMVILLTLLYSATVFCLPLVEDITARSLTLYINLTYLFCSASLAISIRFLLWEVQKAVEESQYKSLLSIQQLQYRKITDELNSFHRARHDMRHHFRVIERLLKEKKTDEASAYISEYTHLMDSNEQEIFCRDPLINALLQYYVGEARQSGILCDINVRLDRCPIDSMDMTVLLGNCLENAVASCLRAPAPRLIRLRVRIVNSTLAILLENTCDSVSFSRPGYQKENQEGSWLPAKAFLTMGSGGQGMESITHTAARYDGAAEFRFQKPLFHTRISLELPPSGPDTGT